MKFISRRNPAGQSYSFPIPEPQEKHHFLDDLFKHSFIGSQPMEPLSPEEKQTRNILANAFNGAESAGEAEFQTYNEVLEILGEVEAKKSTARKVEHLFKDVVDSLADLQMVIVRIDRADIEKGLHIHKLTAEIGKCEGKTTDLYNEMSQIEEKLEEYYPQMRGQWEQIIQNQITVNKQISGIRSQVSDLVYGSSEVSLSEP